MLYKEWFNSPPRHGITCQCWRESILKMWVCLSQAHNQNHVAADMKSDLQTWNCIAWTQIQVTCLNSLQHWHTYIPRVLWVAMQNSLSIWVLQSGVTENREDTGAFPQYTAFNEILCTGYQNFSHGSFVNYRHLSYQKLSKSWILGRFCHYNNSHDTWTNYLIGAIHCGEVMKSSIFFGLRTCFTAP